MDIEVGKVKAEDLPWSVLPKSAIFSNVSVENQQEMIQKSAMGLAPVLGRSIWVKILLI